MVRTARLAPASLLTLALACQPAPTASPGSEPAAADPTAANGGSADPGGPTVEPALDEDHDSDPDVAGDAAGDAVADDVAGAADDVAGAADEPANAAADQPAVSNTEASAAPAAREPLPKPIHPAGNGSCVKKFAVGEKVKGFKLPSLAGDKTISPAGYRNRVVLLNFWASWCKPCLAELPEFDRLYRKYRRHGLTLVAVTTDEDASLVQDFVDDHKLAAKIALEGEQAAGAYGRPNFPFSFVVDGDGTIIAAFEYVDDKCLGDLEGVIRKALEEL